MLRSLVLMRVKDWNYRELRERIADGLNCASSQTSHCLPVPRHDAFHRGFNRLTPETLKAINDLVVQAAVELRLEDGKSCVSTPRGAADRHSSSDRQYAVVGCRSRRHAPAPASEALDMR